MELEAPFYPIIYVRGFAATRSEIENTVATPYMGFNLGSTKIRQNHKGKPVKFIFESPLIRLIKDFDYCETYHKGDLIDEEYVEQLKAENRADRLKRSIWVFRYYDIVSEDVGKEKRVRIPEFAENLRKYIHRIRDLLCDNAAEKRKFKVYLVAHSMGGLICRCYLQNICRGRKGNHCVDKVFTYATPHNGIDVAGMNVPQLGVFDRLHSDNFNRKYMRKYLHTNPASGDVNTLEGAFDPGRFFCLIGTNYKDYDAFFGLSKLATGALSDGLVMIRNAYVKDAPRAFVHRSHSGHYGIVNSEEGYQNLTRFLFGKIRVAVSLETADITLPREVYRKIGGNGNADFDKLNASYYIETAATVRTEKYFINERRVDYESAIRKEYRDLRKKPLLLFTGFLHGLAEDKKGKTPHGLSGTVDGRISFMIQIAMKTPIYEIDNKFWFDSHFEGSDIFNETVIISLDPGDKNPLKYRTSRMFELKPLKAVPGGPGRYRIPIGPDKVKADAAEGEKPAESFWGALILDAAPWNEEAS
ncbi:MAG: hypothetical protein JXR49_12810 [Acidobacteria bacterium]|nr:hypothetical protein [Acidobacteriota bacterium]